MMAIGADSFGRQSPTEAVCTAAYGTTRMAMDIPLHMEDNSKAGGWQEASASSTLPLWICFGVGRMVGVIYLLDLHGSPPCLL